MNMYKDGELIINPDFQRFFRWSVTQQTKFIESILLGIPIPPIFVYQNEKGKWELVDGLQRVSTILNFAGILKDEDKSRRTRSSTKLEQTEMIPSLKGITWKKLPVEPLQLEFKRTKLKIEIIKSGSHKDAKFEVFQRLNTGGSLLSAQEFRNCLLVMLDKSFLDWLETLSQDDNFQTCIDLSDKLIEERYDMELVLRFFVFPKYEFSYAEVSDFLTESMKKIVADRAFDRNSEAARFRSTFALLKELDGDTIFKKNHRGKFLESYFEAIAIGVGQNIDRYIHPDCKSILKNKIDEIETVPVFAEGKGSGTNTKLRVPRIVPFGISYFNI
ncbi:MAG TPA: DUF262 domain-containing protein [Candidatus Acidoferrales bacterium]|nr:DUF262 domain-containing protein [Candidatus Acidoferrales bacterium]